MTYKTINVSDLHVNHHNDRHGELPSEKAAIKWLLENRSSHMKKLAQDIAKEGVIYEPPLVYNNKDGMVVCDGNRRIACLKLFNNPALAHDDVWTKFFQKEATSFNNGKPPASVVCRIEDDLDFIDEILYRRHTGSQGGIGQSQWNDNAKSNFVERTGKKQKINIAEEIEKLLIAAGAFNDTNKVPRSNLNRLLSGQAQRNLVGLSLSINKLFFIHQPSKVIICLKRIVNDLALKKITLRDIWDFEGKTDYLDKLEEEGVLPNPSDLLENEIPFSFPYSDNKLITKKDFTTSGNAITTTKQETHSNVASKIEKGISHSKRTTLIPQDYNYNLPKDPNISRIRAIWEELESTLTFSNHPNAISVLFRVLLELSIDRYVKNHGCQCHENDKLKNKYLKVVENQLSQDFIDKNHAISLKKFAQTEPIFSAQTMNLYVHSPNFSPSPEHLRPMWDNLQTFIVNCISK